jgi:hypothetical protein
VGRVYAAYLHLYADKTGEIGTSFNGQQLVSDQRPTITWTNPGELLIGPRSAWSLPADLQPGDYELWLGIFEPVSGARLVLPGRADHHVLATIHVQNCGQK